MKSSQPESPVGGKRDLLPVYVAAMKLAQGTNQCVGPKNIYYVTLAQLESILIELEWRDD